MGFKEIGVNTRNWIDLAQDRDFWRVLSMQHWTSGFYSHGDRKLVNYRFGNDNRTLVLNGIAVPSEISKFKHLLYLLIYDDVTMVQHSNVPKTTCDYGRQTNWHIANIQKQCNIILNDD